MATEDSSTRTIGLQLSILSGADTAAMQQIIGGMATITQFIKSINATNFLKEAQELSKLTQSMQNETKNILQMYDSVKQGKGAVTSNSGSIPPTKPLIP